MSFFTDNLKALRKQKKLTQQEVADKLEINRVTYTNWEKGNREPNLENVVKLAHILNATTDELLGYKVKK
ncbi:helix-turn-helix domain-containing protein [Streptococcus gallolyticus]|nr:helix-turn-helix domain-containing protein [Streptococcus gallolyticus]MBY5040673.1 helix-turn-helix domain-containing protein [Streptococcus gallolyticus]